MASPCMSVTKITATDLRDHLRDSLNSAKENNVVLVENRRQEAKYLVDKDFLDTLIRERDSIIATVEILADRELASHLFKLAETIDDDVRSGRIHLNSMEDVFGKP
jgi:predicted dinucleotide-utilizing enzyme